MGYLNERQLQLLAESVSQLALAVLVVTVLPILTKASDISIISLLRGLILSTLIYITSLLILNNDNYHKLT